MPLGWSGSQLRIPTRSRLRYARRHQDAVTGFEAVLAQGDLGADRQRALMCLGKSLHEAGRDDRALPLLEALAAEGSGSWFEAPAVHTLTHIAAKIAGDQRRRQPTRPMSRSRPSGRRWSSSGG